MFGEGRERAEGWGRILPELDSVVAWSVRGESVGLYLRKQCRELPELLGDLVGPILVGLLQHGVDVGGRDGKGGSGLVKAFLPPYNLPESC